MKIKLTHKFEDIISIENLLLAWKEFVKGKRNKPDVLLFQLNLMDNLLQLHEDLNNLKYSHGKYEDFFINDPKPRHIHKARVRDRVLHHAIYRILYPFFDKTFIADSFSCRINKGTHKAINRFRSFAYKVSKNNSRTCWILKCDIRKFFDNIDHRILKGILNEYISDQKILWLLGQIIDSFNKGNPHLNPPPPRGGGKTIGLPLGNLTSQLLVNIYMNKFDQFVKHKIKATYYIRYADDFVIFSENKNWLIDQIDMMRNFLFDNLGLELHPNKISIKTLAQGMDFLGFVNFFDHRVLRTKTKRRMLAKVSNNNLPSYLGMLKHCAGYKLELKIKEYGFNQHK